MRGACKRAESECRFAHPQESVTTHEDGSVTVCMDAVKGRCAREPCRYFHPPLHLQAQIKAAQSRATAVWLFNPTKQQNQKKRKYFWFVFFFLFSFLESFVSFMCFFSVCVSDRFRFDVFLFLFFILFYFVIFRHLLPHCHVWLVLFYYFTELCFPLYFCYIYKECFYLFSLLFALFSNLALHFSS